MESTTHIRIVGPSGKTLAFNIKVLGDVSHLKETIIGAKFLSDVGAVTEPLELPYCDGVLDLLIPLIRSSTLIVPPAKLFAEMTSMLSSLAGKCKLWLKYADILDGACCYDILGSHYLLKEAIYDGSAITRRSHVLFTRTREPDADSVTDTLLKKFEIVRNPDVWTATSNEHIVLQFWRKKVQEDATLAPPLVFYNPKTGGADITSLLEIVAGQEGVDIDTGLVIYEKIVKYREKYSHICLPSFYWVNFRIQDD